MYAVAIGISSMLCRSYNTADVSSYCQAHFKVDVCSQENTLGLKGNESMIMFAHM